MDQEEQARAMAAAAAAATGGTSSVAAHGAGLAAADNSGMTATQRQLAQFQAIAAGTLPPGGVSTSDHRTLQP